MVTNPGQDDQWAPVLALGEAKFVIGDAMCHQRETDGVDLESANLQRRLIAWRRFFLLFEEAVPKIPPDSERQELHGMKWPVCECVMSLYGIGPSGSGWLLLRTGWLPRS